ncbi:MAG: hypothetical protein H7A35_06670 [Planctomycetales bacterium]|nr:hypothetical protein [bacterium]UNM09739.1 MAG: hypothetical protein H7A35_06670 [Planctomycetales bacterium]
MNDFPHDNEHDPVDPPHAPQNHGEAAPPPPPDPPSAPPPPPQWQQGGAQQWSREAPPPPPSFQQSSGGGRSLIRGLGIACLSCIGVFAGFFGTCFVVLGGTTSETIPVVVASALVFVGAAVSLYFLIRKRR